jgi:light-regulated signal transduction histidine kinase (bacteriophytochrome)
LCTLSEIAYAAAHDLQSPVRQVAMVFDALGLDDDQAQHDALKERAAIALFEMRGKLDALLHYASLGSAGAAMEFVARAAIDEALERLRPWPEGAELGVQVSVNEVHLERDLFLLLVEQLVKNALLYCATGVPPRVLVSLSDGEDGLVLSVQDHGIGIAEQHHEEIFIAYRRLHTESRYPGQGMGLALCRFVVELHGGNLEVQSTEGEGSTFRATLRQHVVASADETRG